MPRRDAETPARNGYGEAQAAHWTNIGIDAVIAASMYCDHGDHKRRRPDRGTTDYRGEDYATD